MVCAVCKRELKDGQSVIQIMTVVGNPKRGDFVGGTGKYIHIRHLDGLGAVK